MKLLEFIQRNSAVNNCVIFKGSCPFQKELIRMAYIRELRSSHSISSQWLSAKEQGIDEICQNFEQPALFAKPTFYIIDDTQALSVNQRDRLINACLNSTNPKFYKLLYFSKLEKVPDSIKSRIVYSESNQLNSAINLTVQAMKMMELPANKYIAEKIAEIHQSNLLQILSELQKLSLFLEPGEDNFIIQDVLPLFPKKSNVNYFGFLDSIGTRRIKRCLQEIQTLKESSEWEPTRLLISTKSHFRKLLDLKNWIYEPDELMLFQYSHRFLTSRSRREKEKLSTNIRDYFQEQLSIIQFEKFQKQFKSDYYLGKLIFQQHYFDRDKLISLLTECTKLIVDFQLRKSHEEYSIHQFIFNSCQK